MPILRSLLALIVAAATASQAVANDAWADRWQTSPMPAAPTITITNVTVSRPDATGLRSFEVYGRCLTRTPPAYVVCKWGTVQGRFGFTLVLPHPIDDGRAFLPCTRMAVIFGTNPSAGKLMAFLGPSNACTAPLQLPTAPVELRRVPSLQPPIQPRLPRIPGGR